MTNRKLRRIISWPYYQRLRGYELLNFLWDTTCSTEKLFSPILMLDTWIESLWRMESPQTSFNFISAIVFELSPLIHLKSLGVEKIFEIFEVSQFLVSKKFYTRGSRHIYSESILHEEQEYIGLDLILWPSIGTHLPYYLWKYLSKKISIFIKKT
jgi:hypothetical protein